MKRLFTAIEIKPSDELLDCFAFIREQLSGERINWIDIGNLHLTLKFIGEVDEEKWLEIDEILSEIDSISAFTFTLEGLKLFKDIHDPRVIFAQVRNNFDSRQLSLEINNRLSEIGILPEKISFSPHITLGRVKQLKDKTKRGIDFRLQKPVLSIGLLYRLCFVRKYTYPFWTFI